MVIHLGRISFTRLQYRMGYPGGIFFVIFWGGGVICLNDFRPVVLGRGDFVPPDIWQCLETFSVVTTLMDWLLLLSNGSLDARGATKKSSYVQNSSSQRRVIWPSMSIVHKLKNAGGQFRNH